MSAGYVHGATDAREIDRLERQAAWTAAFTFPRFDAAPGLRVLDLACGVGAMAARLNEAFPGCALVGLDLSASQLAACRQGHPEIAVVRADGTRMPFADGTFDRVHCSWMLEHVPAPAEVLRDVRRVLKAGGVAQFIEVDNWSLETEPRLTDVHDLLRRLNEAQVRAGGDPGIGPKLHHHLEAAGFRRFSLEPVRLHATHAQPGFFAGFVEEFTGIFEGLDESLPHEQALIARAVAQLRGALTNPDATLDYTAWLARAQR